MLTILYPSFGKGRFEFLISEEESETYTKQTCFTSVKNYRELTCIELRFNMLCCKILEKSNKTHQRAGFFT